jgi:hypothetical protein
VTQEDINNMSESELAVFAPKGRSQLPGLTHVQWEDGTFSFHAIDLLTPFVHHRVRDFRKAKVG